ncbi:macrophage mannose receptor 1 [Genypterus blacodes]|uniref:macrophage mannose receptor 1 n=1 Tax=Genypterus blacodes TaxID=154954 RepID=UPI003F7667CB
MRLVLFVLCSAVFHFTPSSSRLRQIHLSESPHSREAATQFCQDRESRIITLYDDDDATVSFSLTNETIWAMSWIGLRHNRMSKSTWSDGSEYTLGLSEVNLTNGGQMCEAIDGNNWIGCNCSDTKPFMCRKLNNSYILVEKEKTWCQARQHCTRHHRDLVSISSLNESEIVIEKGKNRSFWIGLLHDEWAWEDDGCSTFRDWSPYGPGTDCTAVSVHSRPSLTRTDCENEALVLCSKGSVRIKVIREKRTWEQAFDYCDAKHSRLLWIENATDQKAVEDWLVHLKDAGPLWLGLRQSRVFGFWFWSSDRMVEFPGWKGKLVPKLPMSHHCGAIAALDDYHWTDRDCRLQLPFLCEEDIPMMKSSELNVENPASSCP